MSPAVDTEWQAEIRAWPVVCFPPKTVLFTEGDPAAAAFLVEDGILKLTTCAVGERPVIAGLRARGSLVGGSAVLRQQTYACTASAVSRCTLRSVPTRALNQHWLASHGTARAIAELLAREVRQHMEWISLFSPLDPHVRLCLLFRHLLRLDSAPRPDGSFRVAPLLTVEEIGQAIARTREATSRLLSSCEGRGILRRENGWYVIPPRSSILEIADQPSDR